MRVYAKKLEYGKFTSVGKSRQQEFNICLGGCKICSLKIISVKEEAFDTFKWQSCPWDLQSAYSLLTKSSNGKHMHSIKLVSSHPS